MSRLNIVTICLDGFPFLPMQLAQFNRLQTDWHWYVCEGVAAPVRDTSWCTEIPPRLSRDGSTEWLTAVSKQHPRVTVLRQQLWPGKTAMFNAALELIKEPGYLLQVDVDELWSAEQLARLLSFFEGPLGDKYGWAQFFCRYYVGPNIVTTAVDAYGNNSHEWVRFWKFEPGNRFLTHEPPVLEGKRKRLMPRDETLSYGLLIDHWAYAYEHQVAFKQQFYGYTDAVKHWRRLQENKVWPVKLKDFLPWVDDRATADLLHK